MNSFAMYRATATWLLAAGNRRIDQMGHSFQPEEVLITPALFLILIGFLLVVTIVAWNVGTWLHRRREQPYNSPRRLFRELCRAHGLSSLERQLLYQIASWHRLPNPNQLFIERELFDATGLAEDVDRPELIESIRDLLFDESSEPERPIGTTVANATFGNRCREFLANVVAKT
jgi:hypothetical protein